MEVDTCLLPPPWSVCTEQSKIRPKHVRFRPCLRHSFSLSHSPHSLNRFHFAMHAILCNRLVLHLHKEARAKMGLTTQFDISSVSTLDVDYDAGRRSSSVMGHGGGCRRGELTSVAGASRTIVGGDYEEEALKENASGISLDPFKR